MNNNKTDKINQEISKLQEKISEYQKRLKVLEKNKEEQENLEILKLVKETKLAKEELAELLKAFAKNDKKAAEIQTNTERELNIDEKN